MRAFVNDNVLDLPPYRPSLTTLGDCRRDWIRLSANENPFPLPEKAMKAISDAMTSVARYPDSSALALRTRIGQRHGLSPEQIVVGAGSTELIAMIISAFLKPGERVLTSACTFLMYRLATIERAGLGAFLETPLREDFSIDLEAMTRRLKERVKLVFVANPNNPTGHNLPLDELGRMVESLPKNGLLVLDQAYQEYVDQEQDPGLSLLKRSDAVILLRTFSKVFGLASMRVGYALGSPRLVDYLNRVKPPFNVGGPAQSAALAMIDERAFVESSVTHNRAERIRLTAALQAMAIPVLPSQTNFLLFMPPGDAGKICQRFSKAGVLLRPGAPFGLPGAIRVTIGRREENDRFLELLSSIVPARSQRIDSSSPPF